MHHNLTESSEKNGSCFTILAIVALASGGLLGGSAWLKGYSFLPFFVAGAGFIFSIYWIVQISEKGMPIWKGIEHYCNLWRITRTGILLYGARHDAPAIFLPWLSIYSVTHADDCILVDTEDCITFTLPVDSGKTESALSLITEQITKHQNKYIGEKKSPAYLQRAPQKTGLLTFLKVGVPWFIVGIAIPFFLPDEPRAGLACAICFAIGAVFVMFGHSDFLDEYEAESFLGNDVRHSRQGLHIQGLAGWHYFQPWAAITKCMELDTKEYFLMLYGGPMGINIPKDGKYLPLPIAGHIKVKTSRWRIFMNYAVVFLVAAAGFVWYACWS